MESSDHRRLRVEVSDGRGRPVASGGLGRWLTKVAPRRARGVVGVALVTDRLVRRLNRHYRGRDQATDVLSFPAGPAAPRRADRFLGDIVIARGIARRQARAAGHSEGTELKVLALHGLLHLLGYDHHADAGEMSRIERRLRLAGGLAAGLIERETGWR